MSQQQKEPQIRLVNEKSVQSNTITSSKVVADGLPVNAETVPGRFPVEPLNALSNFAFLFLIIYWTWKTKFRIRLYPVIVITMPLIFGAFIGGTMHHILRSGKVWHSIVLFCIFFAFMNACVYLWYRVTGSWLKSFLCVLAIPLIFRIFLASVALPDKISVSVVFVVMALAIMIPAVIHCIQHNLKNLDVLVISSIAFLIALVFRQTDANLIGIFPLGTHFLWHIFGMISIFYLMKYMFFSDKIKSKKLFKEIITNLKSR